MVCRPGARRAGLGCGFSASNCEYVIHSTVRRGSLIIFRPFVISIDPILSLISLGSSQNIIL